MFGYFKKLLFSAPWEEEDKHTESTVDLANRLHVILSSSGVNQLINNPVVRTYLINTYYLNVRELIGGGEPSSTQTFQSVGEYFGNSQGRADYYLRAINKKLNDNDLDSRAISDIKEILDMIDFYTE